MGMKRELVIYPGQEICVTFMLFVFPVIDDTTKEIVYRDYVDISVAVATPKVREVDFIVLKYLLQK